MDLKGGHGGRIGRGPLLLLPLFEQLLDRPRDVEADEAAAVGDEGATDQRSRWRRHQHGGALVVGVGELADDQAAEEAAHQEYEHRQQGEGLGPDAIGRHRRDHRGSGHERHRDEGLGQGHQRDQPTENLHGQGHRVDHAGCHHEHARQAHHGGRVAAEPPVEQPSGHGQADQRGHPDEGLDDTPLEGPHGVLVLEQEVELDGNGDEGEAEDAHAAGQVVEGLDLAEPGEGGADRHRQLLDLHPLVAEHGLLLETASGRLAQYQGRHDGGHHRTGGDGEEGGSPGLVSSHQGCNASDY